MDRHDGATWTVRAASCPKELNSRVTSSSLFSPSEIKLRFNRAVCALCRWRWGNSQSRQAGSGEPGQRVRATVNGRDVPTYIVDRHPRHGGFIMQVARFAALLLRLCWQPLQPVKSVLSATNACTYLASKSFSLFRLAFQSVWVVYTSFPMPAKGSDPYLEDAALQVQSHHLRWCTHRLLACTYAFLATRKPRRLRW